MANNLRLFNTNSEYQSADLILPAVSYVVETDKVIYDYTPPTPPVFQGKWKATYQDSHVESAQCDSSSAITEDEINKTNLVSVEIGDCVTSIGNNVFRYCDWLTSISIPSGVTSIGVGVFQSCRELVGVDIPNSVTSIGDRAFADCTSLTSISIPSGVTSIRFATFRQCFGLISIDIPNSVTSIENSAFQSCTSLTSISIPSGVTSINNSAFDTCTSLTSVTVEAITPPILGTRVFIYTNDCPIYVPSASLTAYQTAWSDYADRIQPIP